MKWKGRIVEWLIEELKNDDKWENELTKLLKSDSGIGVHLAIFSEPYFSLLLSGEKTIESRFSINNVSPFGKVNKGDIILTKKAGGPVCAGFIADEVKYFSNLNYKKLIELDGLYGKAICAEMDQDFWSSRIQVKFGTLIKVGTMKKFHPFESNKSDRTAWTVIRIKSNSLFDIET